MNLRPNLNLVSKTLTQVHSLPFTHVQTSSPPSSSKMENEKYLLAAGQTLLRCMFPLTHFLALVTFTPEQHEGAS